MNYKLGLWAPSYKLGKNCNSTASVRVLTRSTNLTVSTYTRKPSDKYFIDDLYTNEDIGSWPPPHKLGKPMLLPYCTNQIHKPYLQRRKTCDWYSICNDLYSNWGHHLLHINLANLWFYWNSLQGTTLLSLVAKIPLSQHLTSKLNSNCKANLCTFAP